MALLTSILGTNYISASPSILNANYQNLNLEVIGANASILVATKNTISISSVAGSVLSISPNATQRVMVWAKGTITGSATSGSVALLFNGIQKDAATVKQAASTDETTYALMYSENPGSVTANIVTSVIATGALVINNPRIVVEIIN